MYFNTDLTNKQVRQYGAQNINNFYANTIIERGRAISVKEWFVWQSRLPGQKRNAYEALVNPTGKKKKA